MTATAHALVGAACAASFSNPIVGLSIATASHPLLDTVPHWDAARGWREKSKVRLLIECCLDLALGIVLAYLIFGNGVNLWYMLACIIASISWDIAEIPYWFFKWRFPPFNIMHAFQSAIQGRANMFYGILTQVTTIALIFMAVKLFR